ncbi:MAG: hypothetical protein ACJ0NO_02560 [Flavobacteriaceae bacterium]
MNAQNKNPNLPFFEISSKKNNYTSVNIIYRLIEGAGYRYYWASKDLKKRDLEYKPNSTSISSYETLEHIYVLSETILNSVFNKVNYRPTNQIPESYQKLREGTLNNLKKFNDVIINKSEDDLKIIKIIFNRDGREVSFPFWNLLNGQISDMIYHTGQIVSFRRTTGNPIQKGVNVFLGKTKTFN